MCFYRLIGMILVMLSFSMQAAAVDLSQPLPVRNFYPPMMRFFDPTPDSALRVYDHSWSLELNQNYSSMNVIAQYPGQKILADMELYVLDSVVRHSVTDNLEFSLRVPVLRPLNGIFDSAINSFHRMVGAPDGGRQLRPNNSFAYSFDNGKGTSWQGKKRWELGNVVLSGRYNLAEGKHWALAALAAVKLPTASKTRGWGSGAADLATGAVASLQLGRWFTHLEAWIVQPRAKNEPGISYKIYSRGSFVVGYEFDALSLIVQAQGGGSPYSGTGMTELIERPLLVAVGLRGKTNAGTGWTMGITENVTYRTTQDISINVGLNWGL